MNRSESCWGDLYIIKDYHFGTDFHSLKLQSDIVKILSESSAVAIIGASCHLKPEPQAHMQTFGKGSVNIRNFTEGGAILRKC